MNKTKVHVEEFEDVLYTWEKDLYAPDPTGTGQYLFLGTVIRINNQLIALDPLTEKQINMLRKAVNEACDHELERRKVHTEDSEQS